MTGAARPPSRGVMGWVYVGDEEPDPRFSLANERTFLAWVRTALAFIACGVAVSLLGVPSLGSWHALVSYCLIAVGVLSAVTGMVRWMRAERAMRMGTILPRLGVAGVVVAGVLISAALLCAALLS